MVRVLSTISFALLMMGCRNSSDSIASSLSGALKPEGFLVIKELVPDSSKPGYFLVTCASSSGDKKASVSQAEIESNKVCLPTAAAASSSGASSAGQSPAASNTQPASGFQAKNLQPTYLKARAAIDVTSTMAGLKVGLDYCVISGPLSATNICVYSEKELKATGVKLSGCDLTSGYLFAQHFSVSPAVSACR
ncbi:MAG: hypothetical protein FJY29_12145 [Betaproteobacteria bacterium]|nr:hypothetical protein [Betaproteobacteria bacterium]